MFLQILLIHNGTTTIVSPVNAFIDSTSCLHCNRFTTTQQPSSVQLLLLPIPKKLRYHPLPPPPHTTVLKTTSSLQLPFCLGHTRRHTLRRQHCRYHGHHHHFHSPIHSDDDDVVESNYDTLERTANDNTYDANDAISTTTAPTTDTVNDGIITTTTTTVGSSKYYQGFLTRSINDEPVERVSGNAILGPTFKFVGYMTILIVGLTGAFLLSNGIITI